MHSFQQKSLGELRQLIQEASLEENRKREFSSVLHVHFKDWLHGTLHSLALISYIQTYLTPRYTRNTIFFHLNKFLWLSLKFGVTHPKLGLGKCFDDILLTFSCAVFHLTVNYILQSNGYGYRLPPYIICFVCFFFFYLKWDGKFHYN